MENFHSIKITYIGPTNTKPARIRLSSSRLQQYVVIPYDYEYSTVKMMAANYLEKEGFEIVGSCEDGEMIITRTFKPFRDEY